MAGAQRGRGRGGRHAQRGRSGRHAPRQHGGPGLLGSNPSSQPPTQLQPPVRVPLPSGKRDPTPPPPALSSPSSHAMTPPMSDVVKSSNVDLSITAAAKNDDMLVGLNGSSRATTGKKRLLPLDRPAALKKSDVEVSVPAAAKIGDVLVGFGGSSTAATGKKRLLPLDRPAPLKNSDVDVSMAHRDDHEGDVLGLNAYISRKRLLSKKASSLPADADGEEEAKDAARKKTRLGWGQGLAKYENRYKNDDETTHKLVAHDGATGEPASSQGSSRPLGSKCLGDNNSLDDMAEMRVSHVTTAPALFSKGSSCPQTGDLSDPGKNGSISSLTKKAVSPAQVPARFPRKHNQNLMADGYIGVLPIILPKVYAVPRKEDNSTTAIAVSAPASSSQVSEAPPDKSSTKFMKVQDDPPRTSKVIVKMAQKPKKILPTNVLSSDEEPETDELQGCQKEAQKGLPTTVIQSQENCCNENAAPFMCGIATATATKKYERMNAKTEDVKKHENQIRSGAKTAEICSSLKECNDAAKNHSWKATETKLANSNIDDGRMAPSDVKNPNSKDNPCITSDPAAMSTGPAFVQHMMEFDEAMEKKESEKNDDKVKGKEGNNPVICVASKHDSGTQLRFGVKSQKEMEKVDSIPSPEGNDLSADMETHAKDSSPCVATNASLVGDDGLIQQLRASEVMYKNSENNDAKVNSTKGNPVHSVASKESNGIQLSCNVTAQKGKSIVPSPEVNDLNAPPMQISNGAPNTYHLPSRSGSASLDMVHANSSYVAMDIDLNIPLDVTPIEVTLVDLGNSTAEAFMGRSSEATDSDATEDISPSQTTTTATQTAQQQPANQPGSIWLFGRVIYQATSTGTTNHTPNLGNQLVVSSSNMPSNPVVPVTRPRGLCQVYPLRATTNSDWRNSIPNSQQDQLAMLRNRILYGSSVIGASTSAPSPLHLQPGSSALLNMMNQHRQQPLANINPYNIMRGVVPVVLSPHLIQGSSGSARLVNFNGFNTVQQQWLPVVDSSGVVLGYAFYYPRATANQAPATVNTMLSTGRNNGDGASTSNTR